mgnify:FL=1
MNRLIAFAMLLFAGTIAAQTPRLPKSAAFAQDFAPEGWHVYFIENGDLNNDRVDDIAFILEDNYSGDRVLGIAFGKKKRGYVLQEQDGGRFIAPKGNTDAFVDMSIQNGTLRFNFLLPGSHAYDNDDSFIFRFQNKRFELIGWERKLRSKKNDRVNEVTSVNFSTQTVIYEDRTKKSETRQKHFDYGRLKSLGEVVPGEFSMNYDKL